MTIGEACLGIYEVVVHKLEQFIQTFDILSTGHPPITSISPTQLEDMLNHSKVLYIRQIQTIT